MSTTFEYTEEQQAAIQSLRDAGCVVVLWEPQEIPDGASDDELEDRAIAAGNNYLYDISVNSAENES